MSNIYKIHDCRGHIHKYMIAHLPMGAFSQPLIPATTQGGLGGLGMGESPDLPYVPPPWGDSGGILSDGYKKVPNLILWLLRSDE